MEAITYRLVTISDTCTPTIQAITFKLVIHVHHDNYAFPCRCVVKWPLAQPANEGTNNPSRLGTGRYMCN